MHQNFTIRATQAPRPTKKALLLRRLIATCLLALPSCIAGNQITVGVSSIATPTATAMRTFEVVPGNPDVDPGDLQFREFADLLVRSMKLMGFRHVDPKSVSADMTLQLSYGISDGETQVGSYSMPVFGQTGVSSSTTYGSVSSYGTFNATTLYQPTYGITGYNSGQYTYTTYTRFLRVQALDRTQSEVWQSTADSTGSSSDLRLIFPYLVTAMQQYAAKSSPGKRFYTFEYTPGQPPTNKFVRAVMGLPAK